MWHITLWLDIDLDPVDSLDSLMAIDFSRLDHFNRLFYHPKTPHTYSHRPPKKMCVAENSSLEKANFWKDMSRKSLIFKNMCVAIAFQNGWIDLLRKINLQVTFFWRHVSQLLVESVDSQRFRKIFFAQSLLFTKYICRRSWLNESHQDFHMHTARGIQFLPPIQKCLQFWR